MNTGGAEPLALEDARALLPGAGPDAGSIEAAFRRESERAAAILEAAPPDLKPRLALRQSQLRAARDRLLAEVAPAPPAASAPVVPLPVAAPAPLPVAAPAPVVPLPVAATGPVAVAPPPVVATRADAPSSGRRWVAAAAGGCLLFVAVTIGAVVLLLPRLRNPEFPPIPEPAWDAAAAVTECQRQVKVIGTAMEMWAVDHQGAYPTKLSVLSPEYLRRLPDCPGTDKMLYALEQPANPRAYTIYCGGFHNDAGLPSGFPSFTSATGLVPTDPILTRAPQDAMDFGTRAAARISLEQWEAAEADLVGALALSPDWPWALYQLSSVQLRRGDAVAAEKSARKAAQLDPADEYAWGNLLMAQAALEDYEGARATLASLEKNVPGARVRILQRQSYVLYHSGDLAAFERNIPSYEGTMPLEAAWDRTLLALAKGDGRAIVEHGRKALQQLGPHAPVAGCFVAYVAVGYELQGQRKEAHEFLAAEIPRLRKAWWTPLALYAAGTIDQAELLARAGSDRERQTEAHLLVGMLASARGDEAAAREHLGWVVENGPKGYDEYPVAREWLKRLKG